MGKNLIQQRRGKGSPTYKSPGFRFVAGAKLPAAIEGTGSGIIKDIYRSPAHSAPIMAVARKDGEDFIIQAPIGVKVGDAIAYGDAASLTPGNILSLTNIPEGTSIYNIEANPGDGGKFAKTSGASAKVLQKIGSQVTVLLPSGKKKEFYAGCRAVVGVAAGSGRKEKPILKAGNKSRALRARNKLYPHVSGISMNAVDHPFGGKSSKIKGRPTQASRNAPRGRKVGLIAPRRTGRKR